MPRCPECRRKFREPEDEVGMHDCPYCGHPRYEEPQIEEPEEEGAAEPRPEEKQVQHG